MTLLPVHTEVRKLFLTNSVKIAPDYPGRPGSFQAIWIQCTFCFTQKVSISFDDRCNRVTKTVLLTLGRLPKALELARALGGLGARVLIAEPFALHVCRASRSVERCFRVPAPNTDPVAYLDAVEKIIRAEKVDILVPVSEEALHVTRLASRLPEHCVIFGPDHRQIVRLHDKLLFNRQAARLGLAVPETFQGHTPEADALALRSDYIVKPQHGCSGIGISLRRQASPLTTADRAPGMIVQTRLPGRHVSSFTIARNGKVLRTVLYTGLIHSGTVCVCFERIDDCPHAQRWVEHFVEAENYSGFISFDFIEDENGIAQAIECNPRLTSGIHFADPDALARLVMFPEQSNEVELRPSRRFQEAHTALLEVYGSVLRPGEFYRRLKAFLTSKDVLFRVSDPLPFLLFTPLSWPVLRQALTGTSLGKAATRDIVWTEMGPADSNGAKDQL
jgi:predicted ATP-grasp superfamily ATP-dependent carboligase